MKHKFFVISALDPELGELALNQFCSQHRIVNLEKSFVANGEQSYWSVCVTWLAHEQPLTKVVGATLSVSRKPKIDYKEVLSPEQFEQFSQLRDLRKKLADQEGSPVYNVFTNEQLALMVQLKIANKNALRQLDGVGEARIEKYADRFLALLTSWFVA